MEETVDSGMSGATFAPAITTDNETVRAATQALADRHCGSEFGDALNFLLNNADEDDLSDLAAALSRPASAPEGVVEARGKLTPEYLAMSPLQKWETLTLHGLLGTDEPWIADMRATLAALRPRPDDAEQSRVLDFDKAVPSAEAADQRHCFGGMTKREVYLAGWSDARSDVEGLVEAWALVPTAKADCLKCGNNPHAIELCDDCERKFLAALSSSVSVDEGEKRG